MFEKTNTSSIIMLCSGKLSYNWQDTQDTLSNKLVIGSITCTTNLKAPTTVFVLLKRD